MIHRKELRRVKDKLNRLQVKHTGQTLDYIEKHTDRDNFMSAEEAKDFNLIDQVVTNLKDIKVK